MEDEKLQKIITASMQIGVFNTLSELGIITENMTRKQADTKHTKKKIDELINKGWVKRYPSGNSKRATYYLKRTEIETGLRMLDIQNIIPINKIFKHQTS